MNDEQLDKLERKIDGLHEKLDLLRNEMTGTVRDVSWLKKGFYTVTTVLITTALSVIGWLFKQHA